MSAFGEDLIEAMGQALAHARGEEAPGTVMHRVVVLDAGDMRAIRKRTGLSRPKFADFSGSRCRRCRIGGTPVSNLCDVAVLEHEAKQPGLRVRWVGPGWARSRSGAGGSAGPHGEAQDALVDGPGVFHSASSLPTRATGSASPTAGHSASGALVDRIDQLLGGAQPVPETTRTLQDAMALG